ncbi:cytochrome c biogenesis protein CcdC [Bacillus sp. FJAT-47783]|uniref:CcdC family protein n=1 Tax=Bacillus sp. FJAT-47783 TaxID=2922712 RepID=UPI001FAB4D99|nr:cytochrome c biogenesis protein CcdC [Bacillus sp. FJAT-47783]
MMIAYSILGLLMGLAVIIVRTKAAKKPATVKKIILPPIFMSTGALMYIFPAFRITPLEIVEALAVGFIFSIILMKTSHFERKDEHIYLKRSKAFPIILISLLLLRIILKSYLSTTIDLGELSGMFWMLAFGMIVPWRISMYMKFRKMKQELESKKTND